MAISFSGSAAFFLFLAFAVPALATPSFNTSTPWNAVTTFESIGLYWKPTSATGGKATVRFREQGTSTWREGHELWWDSRNAEFRGSLVELQADKVYEIQLKLGTGAWTNTGASCNTASANECNLTATATCTSANETQCTRTWSENFPGQTINFADHVSTSGLPRMWLLGPDDSGTPGNWKIYTPTGAQTSIDQSNDSLYGSFDGDRDSCIILENVSYVVIRGINLVGCRASGIELRGNTHHVVIDDNTISGFGRFGTGFNGVTRAGEPTADAGVLCFNQGQVRQIVIQKNLIHTPRHTATHWNQLATDNGHPKGPHGTRYDVCGQNHVVRYNDIAGTSTRRFQDGMSGAQNFGPGGGFPFADSDIYGNRISEIYDDGIEAEGENRNVRIWGNYFDHVFTALGNAASARGPLYVWRNVTNWMANMRCPPSVCDSDTTEERGPFVKGGGQPGSYNGGIAYYYHNTLLQPPPSAGKQFPMGAGWGVSGVEILYNFVSRNNIWHIHKITDNPGLPDYWSIRGDCSGNPCTPPVPDNGPAVDYDVFNGRIATAGPNAETNAVNLNWGEIGGDASKVPTYAAGSSYPTAIPSGANNWTGDFRLAASSLGTSNVPLLPNFNDLDTIRHVGAQPPNQTEMKFGRAAAGTTVTLMQGLNGYTGSTDSWIRGTQADTNMNGLVALSFRSESMDAAVIRFAIFQSEGGPVPNAAIINSATLSLYKFQGPDAVVKASRLLKSFDETQVTWNIAATGTSWTTPGALSSGNDYFASADGQGSVADAAVNNCNQPPYTDTEACWLHIDVTSGVQAFAGGTPNHGWKVAQVSSSLPTTFKSFNSNDAQTHAARRPKLTITYQ